MSLRTSFTAYATTSTVCLRGSCRRAHSSSPRLHKTASCTAAHAAWYAVTPPTQQFAFWRPHNGAFLNFCRAPTPELDEPLRGVTRSRAQLERFTLLTRVDRVTQAVVQDRARAQPPELASDNPAKVTPTAVGKNWASIRSTLLRQPGGLAPPTHPSHFLVGFGFCVLPPRRHLDTGSLFLSHPVGTNPRTGRTTGDQLVQSSVQTWACCVSWGSRVQTP